MATDLRDDGQDTKGHPAAQRIHALYKDGTDDIRDAQLQYQENAAYIEGDQWIWRSSTRQEILRLPRVNPTKIRATIPRLGPESRRLFSKLLRRPLVFEVTPDAPDDATIRGARIAEAVLTAKARDDKWGHIREDVAWGAWKGGTAFLCLDWDTTRGKYVGDGPTTGQPLYEGDIQTTALTITEVATEPGTKDIERACWWIKAQVLPPAEVKKTYGLSTLPPPNASAGQSPMQRELVRSGSGSKLTNMCLVLTYYERPNRDNKKGTVMTVVGEQVVDGPHDWPFPFTDRLNIVAVKETTVEGRWYGRTVVSDAVPIQTAYNHTWTSILEHLKQAGNARMQGNSAERSNADTWTDEAGEFIFYDTDPWAWLSPPPMPDWWSRLPQQLAESMDDTIGVHDISRGQAPANIESGLGLSVLAEQDDTPTGKFAQTLADAFGDYATLVLRTLEEKVTEERTITLYEPGAKIAEKVRWTGESFEGQIIARVPYEAVAPMNDAARWARGLAMVDRQIIQGGRALAKYLDVEGANDFAAALDPQVEKARRENSQLALGEPCVPADFDNHQVHIEEHNDFRLSARYERLDEQARALVDMHVQAHSTLAAEEAALQMARLNQGQAAAMAAAQGSMPPGSGTLDQILGVNAQAPSDPASPISATLGAQTGGAPDEMAPPGPDAEQGMPTL